MCVKAIGFVKCENNKNNHLCRLFIHAGSRSIQDELAEQQEQLNSAQRILSCFYRRVPWNGEERGFIYVRRLGRTVNFEATRVPFVIDRLVYFYEQLGYPLSYLQETLSAFLRTIQQTELTQGQQRVVSQGQVDPQQQQQRIYRSGNNLGFPQQQQQQQQQQPQWSIQQTNRPPQAFNPASAIYNNSQGHQSAGYANDGELR